MIYVLLFFFSDGDNTVLFILRMFREFQFFLKVAIHVPIVSTSIPSYVMTTGVSQLRPFEESSVESNIFAVDLRGAMR